MQKPTPFSRRELGILLHPTSLYNHEDIGTLGKYAYEFVDWLESTRVSLWQILPLTRNGRYNSPYFSYSTFAGNPWLVDLETLHGHGLLPRPILHSTLWDHRIPFGELGKTKLPQLLTAADNLLRRKNHPWRPRLRRVRRFAGLAERHGSLFRPQGRLWRTALVGMGAGCQELQGRLPA